MRLENLSIGNRIAITLVIVLAVLFGLALYGYLTGAWDYDETTGVPLYQIASAESKPEPLCLDNTTRERIKSIMIEALDDSLKEQIQHLFLTWLKDERGQPDRAKVGVEQAIRAHQRARRGAEEWAPPLCAG